MELGTVVVDETVLPVVRVELYGGAFVIIAKVSGPLEKRPDAPVMHRLHGADGSLVYVGSSVIGWPQIGEGDNLEVTLRAEAIDKVTSEERTRRAKARK